MAQQAPAMSPRQGIVTELLGREPIYDQLTANNGLALGAKP